MSSHILNNFFIRAYRDENVIDYVKNRVAAYEDSVLKYNEMVRMAAYKDSVANELRRESNSIKRTIKNYQ
jgi:hypothetical protein